MVTQGQTETAPHADDDTTMRRLYSEKQQNYYRSSRPEVLPYLPQSCARALDVGCGEGVVLAALKREGRCREAWGIEFIESAAQQAASVLDHVVHADLDCGIVDLPMNHFDLVLCLDVLEHLRDPWRLVDQLVGTMTLGGRMVISVPNIRYWSVLRSLLLDGRFDYQQFGIMDRTHLRFFTKHTAKELLTKGGLSEVELHLHPSKPQGWRNALSILSAGHTQDLFAWQLIVTGTKG